MKNIAQVKVLIIKALSRMHGEPMPEATLIASVKILHAEMSDDETRTVIGELQSEGFLSGSRDELTDVRHWSLTNKGIARATQLR